jgi:hypothetical protein
METPVYDKTRPGRVCRMGHHVNRRARRVGVGRERRKRPRRRDLHGASGFRHHEDAGGRIAPVVRLARVLAWAGVRIAVSMIVARGDRDGVRSLATVV